MTEASIALTGVLILAVLGVAKMTLDYFNRELFPQLKTLTENISSLRADHAQSQRDIALAQQQTNQNTARLNGQSAKIDTILLAAPSVPSAPIIIAPPTNAYFAPPADLPASMPAGVPASTEAATTPAPRPVNVTINADAPLSAGELLNAHAQLDAQAIAGASTGTEGD